MGNVKREKSSCKSAATGDTIATFSDTLSPVSVAATSWEFPEIYHPFLNSQHISFFLSFFKFATFIIIFVLFVPPSYVQCYK